MITLVFDTETTGVPIHPKARMDAQPRILEFGCALVDEEGRILREINLLINPGKIPSNLPKRSNLIDKAKIFKITGIDTDDLVDEPTFEDVLDQIRPFFEEADQLIAHNLPFDKAMMELDLKRAGVEDWPWPKVQICTVQEHVEEFGRFMKLLELYEHYTGKPLDQTHRALDDVHALIEVCKGSGVLR
jgi:DNA polymerase-3 subunit epsilon